MSLYITILAGGLGKRMQSNMPKVLHEVKGEAMIIRIIKEVLKLDPSKIIVVVGKFYQLIKESIEMHIKDPRITYAIQESPLGTGDAVKATLPLFEKEKDITNIILNGDVPLLQYSTIKEIYDNFKNNNSNLLITCINLEPPNGHGRIVIDENNNFKEIVEEKDCDSNQYKLSLVNCGIYLSSGDVLKNFIPQIKNNNIQSEYYITDLVKLYSTETKQKVDLFVLPKEKLKEIYNVNTAQQLTDLNNLA